MYFIFVELVCFINVMKKKVCHHDQIDEKRLTMLHVEKYLFQ